MLDPSCGSGTFLFAAIRRLRDLGFMGPELVRKARQQVLGFDIHPLAVTIARANYVLALRGDLRATNEDMTIPVFMADTLAVPTGGFGRMVEIVAPVEGLPVAEGEPALPARFQLPTERAENQVVSLAEIVALVDQLSDPAFESAGAEHGLAARLTEWNVPYSDVWKENLRLLRALRAAHRNTIWNFVLTNAARPHEIAAEPVQLVVGNPPWLTLREMAGNEYRARVRAIADEFNLVPSGGARMAHVSHIDTATVFALFCAEHFLPDAEGRVAFVLPRSVMAGAMQHSNFREGRARFSYAPVEAIDLDAVEPLFRIPAAVMIFDKVSQSAKPPPPWEWPSSALAGQLPRKNASRAEAENEIIETDFERPQFSSVPSPYLAQTQQGADLRPRAFCIVEPDPDAQVVDSRRPYLRSERQAVDDASPEWRGVSLKSRVEADYLYATSLSIDPFRVGPLRLAALPIKVTEDGEDDGVRIYQQPEILAAGDVGMASWLKSAEEEQRVVLERTNRTWHGTVVDYLNTQQKLAEQKPRTPRVIWGKGGTHIRAAVAPMNVAEVHGIPVHGYVVDLSCYCVICDSDDEAGYLCAMLNSRAVDNAITAHQTRGEQGPRDIHRRPVAHVPIPRYNGDDPDHARLAGLTAKLHKAALAIEFTSARRAARYRDALGAPVLEIDAIAERVLAVAYAAEAS
jgi:hypothetical protein